MRKRHFGRLLSAVLSATLAFTSVIPSYAMEGVDADELSKAQGEAEAEEEAETEEPAEDTAEDEEVLIEEDESEDLVAGGPDSYTVTFDYNIAGDDTDLNDVTVEVTDENDQTVEEPTPEYTGHHVTGWYKKTGDNEYSEEAYEFDTVVSGDITLRAAWAINTYKIVYDANGGSGAMDPDEDVAYDTTDTIKDSSFTAPDNMVFAGWNTDAEGEGESYAAGDPAKELTEDNGVTVTLFAQWAEAPEPEKFAVTFWDGEDELTELAQQVEDGKKATEPEAPSKKHYKFVGWFTTDELSEPFDFANTAITKETQIFAKFEGESFKVKLDKNCKDAVTGLPDAENGFVGITVKYGEKYTDLPELTREGYDFLGWYTDSKNKTYKKTKDSVVTVAADATLYAHWAEAEIKVTFDWCDKPINSTIVPVTVKYGTKIMTVAPKESIVKGYKIEGWYDGTDYTTANKLNDTTVAKEDVTYYANCVPVTYTVKFDANGGKGDAIADQKRAYNDNKSLTKNTFTRDNYSFSGWNTQKDGLGEFFYNESESAITTVDGATVTLYAQWSADQKTVVFDYGYKAGSPEEEVVSSFIVRFGEEYPEPETDLIEARPGFYFDGWYDGDKKVDITKAKVEKNITLLGKWTKVTYKATFNSNIGKKPKTKTVTLNEEHTDAIDFTDIEGFTEKDKAGKTFEGWATADDFYKRGDLTEKGLIDALKGDKTSSAKEVTTVVYAQWESAGMYHIKLMENLPKDTNPEDLHSGADGKVETVNFAEPFFLTGHEFILDGYALAGWTYKDDKGKTVTLKPAAKLVGLTAENDKTVEVSAKWKATSYTIKYNLNGGTAKKGTKTTVKYKVDANTRKGLPLLNYMEVDGNFVLQDAAAQPVTKRGYRFVGWDVTACYYGKDQYYSKTLTARWEPLPYTLRLDLDGGKAMGMTGSYIIDVNIDDTFPIGSWTPSKDGYTFTGWTGKNVKGKTKKYSATTANVRIKDLAVDKGGTSFTLKATYKANSYKITYLLDGGTINKNAPKSYVTGSSKNKAIPTPVKPGYTFAGWSIKDEKLSVVGDTAYDEATKKIKDGASGNLIFDAFWSINRYEFAFYSSDGKTEYAVSDYSDLMYDSAVDFTAAAKAIEGKEGFEGGIKGFALTPDAKKPTYALNRKYTRIGGKTKYREIIKLYVVGQPKVYRISYDLDGATIKNAIYEYTTPTAAAGIKFKATAAKKGYTFKGFTCEDEECVATNDKGFVTAIKQNAARDLEFKAVFDNEVSYSIVAMPNAGNVTDESGKVDAKKGVQFQMDGVRQFPIGNEIPADALRAYLGWSRPGYHFAGFSTTKNGKKLIDTLGGLSYSKKKVVTVYAIWEVNVQGIVYEQQGEVLRNGQYVFPANEGELGIKFAGSSLFKYGKAVSTKKVAGNESVTFAGWKIDEDRQDKTGLKVTYTDKTKKYVKSIAKDNTARTVFLRPVFELKSYNLYIDPNGGTFKGSKKKQLVGKKYVNDRIDTTELRQYLAKSGYKLAGLSATKDPKRLVGDYARLSGDKKGNATLTAIWTKLDVSKPAVLAHISGTRMAMSIQNAITGDDIYYELQYSSSAAFTYDVKTVKLESTGLRAARATVVEGKDYYLRARLLRKDSTNNYVSSGWTATVRASRVVVPAELASIAVATEPTKTEYCWGEVFDPTGLVITATYDDEKTESISYAAAASAFTFSPDVMGEDTHSVTITYGGKTTSVLVDVEPSRVAITFDANGGAFEGGATTKQVICFQDDSLDSIPDGPATTPPECSFDGWYTEAEGGEKVTSSTRFTAPTTVYAQYRPNA